MAATGSKKRRNRAQSRHAATENASGMKSKQTQIDSRGKGHLEMKALGAQAWLKALVAAEKSSDGLRQSSLIAHLQPTCSAPWPQSSNAASLGVANADLKHQIADLML